MTPTIILTATKDILSNPDHWGAFSLVAGKKHCLLGAILVGAGHDPTALGTTNAYTLFETEQVVKDTIDIVYESMRAMVPYEFTKHKDKSSPNYENVSFINDALRLPEVRHSTMMNILDNAINLSKAA